MVGTSWVMTGVEYDEYVSLLSGLCASDLKGATQRCRIFYFILIITVEKNPVLIQSKKAKGRAPANDRQYKDSERSVEDDYCHGWSYAVGFGGVSGPFSSSWNSKVQ